MRLALFLTTLGLVTLSSAVASADEATATEGPPRELAGADLPPCPDTTATKARKKLSLGVLVMGVRPSLTHLAESGAPAKTDAGVAFAGAVDSYAANGAAHVGFDWVLGGGQAGFDYRIGGIFDVGHRFRVTKNQGPFVRAGFDGQLQGNRDFYFSALELPRGMVGYQYAVGTSLLEAGVRGGPILGGRFNPGEDGYRSLSGSLEMGGFLSARGEHVKLDATGMVVDAWHTGDHRPVDVGRGDLCGLLGNWAICADVALMRGDAAFDHGGGTHEAVATYAGLTFGTASW